MTFLRDDDLQQQPKTNSYDDKPTPALLKFMTSQWKLRGPRKLAPVRYATSYARRRAALSAQFPGEVLVVPTGHEKVRANDTTYRFRPSSDFFYLTGCLEPDCVLVLLPNERGGHRSVLFVEENPGKTDATFFTDRRKGELWVGPRLGVAESQLRFQVDEAQPLGALVPAIEGQKNRRVMRGVSLELDLKVPADDDEKDAALATALSEMRLIKDAAEIKELRAVIDSTQRGFEDIIRGLPGFSSEREVEGTFAFRARVEGNDVGYGTIAAAGAHACTLHWTHNDGEVKKGELLLIDAGVEGNSLYTADITRTLPVSGTFSTAQREIYDLVLAAQTAAFAGVKPGNDFMEPNRRAMKVLAEGLERLKILPMSAAEALAQENQFYKRYSLHNVSHMLGLDVHDCARARQEAYKAGALKVGMVLTVEPGLYFQTDDLTVPARYRGIGVRIEDDVVVTAKGCTVLSSKIPRESKAVEEWMRSLKKSPEHSTLRSKRK